MLHFTRKNPQPQPQIHTHEQKEEWGGGGTSADLHTSVDQLNISPWGWSGDNADEKPKAHKLA